jgi:phage gpG-like protein
MTPKEINKELAAFSKELKAFGKVAKTVAGVTAVSMFKKNFQKESFFGRKWKQVKRRIPGTKSYKYPKNKPARRRWKILTNSGNLGRSIKKQIVGDGVIVFSDLKYSKIHNEGGFAGRKSSVKIKPRPFIGKHKKLEKAVTTAIENELNKIKL